MGGRIYRQRRYGDKASNIEFPSCAEKRTLQSKFQRKLGNLENLVKFCEFLNICFLMLLHVFLPHA